jgi:chromosome segregation ATPase
MLSSASKDLRSVAKTRSQLEKSNEEMTREIKIVKEQLRQYAEQTNGTEKDVEALKRQLRQQREVCADHNAEMQSLQEQLAFSQQQLTIFKGKYEEVSRLAEVQLKESAVSKAKIKSLQTVEKEIEELKDSIDVAKQEHRKLAEASNYKDR